MQAKPTEVLRKSTHIIDTLVNDYIITKVLIDMNHVL
jgi:hypothetical protein